MINSKQEQLDALILCEQLVQSASVVRHTIRLFFRVHTSTLHAKFWNLLCSRNQHITASKLISFTKEMRVSQNESVLSWSTFACNNYLKDMTVYEQIVVHRTWSGTDSSAWRHPWEESHWCLRTMFSGVD